MGHFSLTWSSYKQNICSGLSGLQQNGELVDMTLAADGHYVKVHQLVMSLVSPYIKELIASADCPHPVIFLNKISSPTLHSMLEYVYTGEVVVSKENLMDLVEVGKELRIKGLEDMVIYHGLEDMNVESTSDLKPQALIAVSKKRKSVSNTGPLEKKTDITLNEVSADDEKPNTLKLKINKREANDEIIEPIDCYKAGSRWFYRDDYFYVATRTRGATTSFKCCMNRCPAHFNATHGQATAVIGAHDHPQTPWIPNRNTMYQALRRRAKEESIPLNAIYEEEAARYPDAAPHMRFESVVPSMRKWRREAQPAIHRTLPVSKRFNKTVVLLAQ